MAGLLNPFLGSARFVWPSMTANPTGGVAMSWRSAEPVEGSTSLGGSALPEFIDVTFGGTEIWHMHQAVQETGTNVPMTNAIVSAGVRIEWSATVSLARIRLDNTANGWGATRTPKGFKVWGRRASDGQWTLLDSSHAATAVDPGTDTGLLALGTAGEACTEHFVWLIGTGPYAAPGANSAQSLALLDLQ